MPSATASLRATTPAEEGLGAAPAELGRSAQALERRGSLRPDRLTPTRKRMRTAGATVMFRIIDAVIVSILAAMAADFSTPGGLLQARMVDILPTAIGALTLLWSLRQVRVYRFAIREGFANQSLRVTSAFVVAAAAASLALQALPETASGQEMLFRAALGGFAGLGVLHLVWRGIISRWRAEGRLTPNIIIVGANENAERLIASAAKTREVAVIGIFDDRLERAPSSIGGVPVLGNTKTLVGHRVLPFVDRIVIAVNSGAQARVREIISRLSVLPNEVSVLIDGEEGGARSAALSRIADATVASIAGGPSDERRALVKRCQDLVIGTVALIVAAPVMLIIAIAVKLDSPGPVFFRQRRHGFNNEEILVWKFRSMQHHRADHTAARQTTLDDERVTRVGRILRPTSLDELPQIFNVLRGEMSLVGPRPHAVGMKTGDVESARLVAEYAHRHRIKPGMTGWAAIHGSRGPVDTPELVRRRVALDVDYIERQSFWLDLWIMLITIPCLLGDRDTVR